MLNICILTAGILYKSVMRKISTVYTSINGIHHMYVCNAQYSIVRVLIERNV